MIAVVDIRKVINCQCALRMIMISNERRSTTFVILICTKALVASAAIVQMFLRAASTSTSSLVRSSLANHNEKQHIAAQRGPDDNHKIRQTDNTLLGTQNNMISQMQSSVSE